MIKNILLTTLLSLLFSFNVCGASNLLEFYENEDCHILRIEQKGIGSHEFMHIGMNGNPFILKPVFYRDCEALSLTDFKGKTNELIDVEGSSLEITECYAWDGKEKIKIWVVCGSRLPKYLGDLSMADGSGYLIERARNHYDIFIIAPTKEGGYKVAFKLGSEDLKKAESVPYPKSFRHKQPYERTVSVKRLANIRHSGMSIFRAKYDFDSDEWNAFEARYSLLWDKENYELEIKKVNMTKIDHY